MPINQRSRVARWHVVDLSDPTMLNHHWSLFATPNDGMGGGYADAIDIDTTDTECLNVSTEEPSSRHELRAVGCHVAALAAPQLRIRQNVGTANSSPHEPDITSTKSQSTPTYTHTHLHIYISYYLFINTNPYTL